MQFYRCKCGKSELYTTDGPGPKCSGCDKCNTTYAQTPDGHEERIPHDWKPQFNKSTGEPDRPYCRRCYAEGEVACG